MNGNVESNNEIHFLQFNPKKRWVVTAGSNMMANLWDLRRDDFYVNLKCQELPHLLSSNPIGRSLSDVTSVHWNSDGNRMITSSSDKIARVWGIDDDRDEAAIKTVRPFSVELLNSKFNEYYGNLVATGGMMSEIIVWDWESED